MILSKQEKKTLFKISTHHLPCVEVKVHNLRVWVYGSLERVLEQPPYTKDATHRVCIGQGYLAQQYM